MSWTEVSIDVDHGRAERWADLLLDAGALSVQAEDADRDSPDEQALFGEPGLHAPPSSHADGATSGSGFGWRRTRLAILVERHTDAAALVAQASAAIGCPTPPIVETRTVEDRDWVAATQAQFEPIPVGERLLIVPSWHAGNEQDRSARDRLQLVVDPGLAFGTGSHPTTRLCLEWLDQARVDGRSVLDYGCGSGILAIAAARLGAVGVVALDIDPVAVDAAAANAARNGVDVAVASSAGRRPSDADVVVANILSSPLKLLAPLLASLVRPGGSLVLSGVLERQVDEVAASYAALLPVQCWRVLDGWACLVGRRA